MDRLCNKCSLKKDISLFNKNKSGKYGVRSICRECDKVYHRQHYVQNFVSIRNSQNIYAFNNKEKTRIRSKNYEKKNRVMISKKKREKLKSDPLAKLAGNIRTNIGDSFKRAKFRKSSKSTEILGCSMKAFKSYIESKFEPWMNWSNYGNQNGVATVEKHSWDLDHITPLHSAKNEEELYVLNHYSNFQPLCSFRNRNIKKGKLLD